MRGSPAETETPIHWNLIGHSTTTPLPVLMYFTTLPPPSSHRAVIPTWTEEEGGGVRVCMTK